MRMSYFPTTALAGYNESYSHAKFCPTRTLIKQTFIIMKQLRQPTYCRLGEGSNLCLLGSDTLFWKDSLEADWTLIQGRIPLPSEWASGS